MFAERKRAKCKQTPSSDGFGGLLPVPAAALGRGRAAGQENSEGNVSCGTKLFHAHWNVSGRVADFTGVVYSFLFFFFLSLRKNNKGKERKVFPTVFHPFYQKLGI